MAEPKYNPKSKTWSAVVFSHKDPNGKRHYKSITAPTKREWKQKEAEFLALRKGKSADDMTVRDCVEQYIASKDGVLSPSTIRGYRACAKRYKSIDNILVSNLDSADLQFFVSNLSRTLSPKTVRETYSLLTSAIAVIDDRRFRVTLPTRMPIQYHTPTDDQVSRLMQNASPDMKMCIVLAAVGTLRRGEVCALEYEDVLYDFNAVFVHRSMIRDTSGAWIVRDMPKTSGSVRRVILPREVIDMIGTGEGRIIRYTPNGLTENFIKLRDRLGMECRYHDLRHYAASVMHAIGVPDKYIMERGGWSDDRILKSVYQNTLSDKSKVFTEKTNDYFAKSILA